MWRYRKPGFQTLLIAELQRQQQRSQFCDALLKAEGVSVPAHSCVLSAISPQLSTSLTSMPAPPAGQSHLVEFGSLGAGTLLHVVRLLYSGEMAGEGEREKQEAISAAATLGIHELTEVTGATRRSRNGEGGGRHAEVGVQTEERQTGRATWRREAREGREGGTCLWKEPHSVGGKDSWTQTEELQVNDAPPPAPVASFETIDVTSLQSLGLTNAHLPPSQIPYIPIPLICTQDESQTLQSSSAPAASAQDFFAAEYAPLAAPPSLLTFPTQAIQWAADPRGCWADPHAADRDAAAAGDNWEDEWLQQFQGSIPEFIHHFLKPEKEEGRCRGRTRRGRAAEGAGRASRRRARRARAAGGRRGRGGLTQTVDAQEVGVSQLPKPLQQRCGMPVRRWGQGGGAVGRRLFLTTREPLKLGRSLWRRKGCRKSWDSSLGGECLPRSETGGRGGGAAQRGRRQQVKQDVVPVSRAQRARAKSATSTLFCNHQPAAPDAPPAASLLHTTALPPPLPPPHEDQPDLIDRLLEELISGLDPLPNHPPTGGGTSGAPFSQSIQQSHAAGPNAGPCSHGRAEVAAVRRARGGSSAASAEVPVPPSQAEGELAEMLDHFLQSFEPQTNSRAARKEKEASRPPQRAHRPPHQRGEALPKRSKQSEASAAPPRLTEGASTKRQKRRRKNQYWFSLEKHRTRKAMSDAKAGAVHECAEKQLQQMPVVKLERSVALPMEVASHMFGLGESREAQTLSTSVKFQRSSLSKKNQAFPCATKTYPIRSRFKVAQILDRQPLFESPLVQKQPHKAAKQGGRRGRPRKNGLLPSFVNDRSLTTPIQPQYVEPGGRSKHSQEENQERRDSQSAVLSRGEVAESARRATKRCADSEEQVIDGARAAKSICVGQPTSTWATSTSGSPLKASEAAAAESEEVIDVEAVWLMSPGWMSQTGQKAARGRVKPEAADGSGAGKESATEESVQSGDEIIDVEGDSGRSTDLEGEEDAPAPAAIRHYASPPPHSPEEVNLGSAGSPEVDSDVDVVGGSVPTPDPVSITWTESSEGEEEKGDVDVSGETTDCSPSAVLAISKAEVVNRK